MRLIVVVFASVVALAAVTAATLADSTGKGLVINASGTYEDEGVWLYRTPEGKYGFGPAFAGTNELLVMPSPSPEPGGAVVGVEIIRHPFDTLGYPMHIALVEKLFAASYQITINASNAGELWKYEYGDPVINEAPITNASRPAFKSWGPFPADAVPMAQAPDPELQGAFDFAKGALNSIGNMPDSQKNLANYGVLFIDDGSTIWVELGPRFAPQEAPHLGCQTQLGRDMVFGYDKKRSERGKVGKFLQCF
jgi:hypothetical protein